MEKRKFDVILFPLIAILLGFVTGAIFILIVGLNPLEAYGSLFAGAFGTLPRIGETLLKTTPLIFTGLAVGFAYRCGLFNIGATGQYITGAIMSVAVAYMFQGLPSFILIPLVILVGGLMGGIWGGVAGYLKAKLGIHEVLSTIMLNYVALWLANYATRTFLNPSNLQDSVQKAHTVIIPDAAKLTKLKEIFPAFGYSSINTGIFIAVITAFVIYVILFKTPIGYEIRAVGLNRNAAECGGISPKKNIILAMGISGMLAGLAGAVQITGLIYKFDQVSAFPSYGFDGIAVALVGASHPLGILASGLLFGVLKNGATILQIDGIPQEVIGIIQGIIIIFVAGDLFIKKMVNIRRGRKDKKITIIEEEVAENEHE